MTTPPGGLTQEGAQYGYILGRYQNMRMQQADDMHRNKATVINEIAFRQDNRNHTSFTAMGRTWSSVKLNMSEQTNFSTMSRTFATNVGASATTVFNNQWTWPTQVGTPLLKPDIWGGLKGQLRVPFTKPWIYTGKNSILADYTFNNGKLANGYTLWTGTRASSYYMDSEYINTFSKRGGIERVPAFAQIPKCNDSAITTTTGAYTYGYSYTYGAISSTITLRNKLLLYHYSYYTAPNAPVIHALGLGGSKTGVNLGANCNPLYVDLSKLTILMTFKTLPTVNNRPIGNSGTMGWLVPWAKGLANLDLWIQAAWLDSKTKAFSLTSATHVTLPNGLPPSKLPAYKSLYRYDTTSTTGFGPYTSGYNFPYTRYKTK